MGVRVRWVLAACAGAWMCAPAASAQPANPVYADLSPVAHDTLVRVREFIAAGNLSEAARECQRLLDEQPARVVPSAHDEDLFGSVRDAVHATLLSAPALLERYRVNEEPVARDQLAAGTLSAARAVETSRLLTPSGLEAALRLAQDQLETACFEAARLTLESLERHPDRRGGDPELGRRAARLMLLVARYVPGSGERRGVWERAERWAREVRLATGTERQAAERPPRLDTAVLSLSGVAGAVHGEGVPASPLWSAALEPRPDPVARNEGPAVRNPNQGQDATSLWIAPSVAGDTLYINDGTWISARDRYTLQVRWAVQPSSDGSVDDPWGARSDATMRGMGRMIEDVNTVTVAGPIVLATTGLARDGSRDGDPRTHAIDAATGRVLWSVHVPALDPQLDSGSVRGPVMVDGDTVVVAVRKAALTRRVVSVYLAGLSLRTGELRWARLVGSAGALPFIQQRRIGDAGALAEGVVYLTDQLGVVAAYEAAGGRPVWVRRMPVARGGDVPSWPWRWNTPIVDGDGLLILAPDLREIVRVSRETGEITARRSTDGLADPGYLVRAGEHLAAVGDTRIAVLPLADVSGGAARLTRAATAPGIRGRVVPAGGSLVVPRGDGVAVIDAARPEAEGTFIPLERVGNVLPAPSQLVVIDPREVHSYLAWPVAQQLLSGRMAANPDDPEPAITYAELAYRAGHPREIAGAVDKALAALERNSEGTVEARTRLFESLRAMVEASQERWTRPRAADPSHPVLDRAVLGPVIDRMGRAARTADDRVAHLMALGRLREAEARPGLAVEAYQRILGDGQLAAVLWRGPGVRIRAELEAARRIRSLVLEHGPASYAAFEQEAQFALAALGTSPGADGLESVARRYPAAAISAELWMRVAEAHERSGRRHASVEALRESLAAAELARASGQRVDPTLIGEVAGRLVTRLQAMERVFAAASLLERVRRELPGITLTSGGAPLEAEALASQLSGRLASAQRLPRIGATLQPDVQTLEGWGLMSPISRERPATEHVMLISRAQSSVALWGLPAGRAGADQPGGTAPTERLAMYWSRAFDGSAPVLLRLDPESVYLLWEGADGGSSIERIDAVTGRTRWRSEPLRQLFAGNAAAAQRAALAGAPIDTPLDGSVRATDVLVTFDEQAVVLADRIGRVAVFDPPTGAVLWTALSEVQRVFDLDAGGGSVVIGGVTAPPENPGALVGLRPIVMIHDARSGQAMRRLDALSGPVRWLRHTTSGDPRRPPGTVLVAVDTEILSVDPATGRTNWVIAGGPAFNSLDAWVFGDRLFVMDENRGLWMVSISSGRVPERPLETFDRLAGTWPVQAASIPTEQGSLVAFLTGRGVLVYDPGKPEGDAGKAPTARLVGLDALGQDPGVAPGVDATGGQQLLPPVATQGYFVAAETWPTRLADGRPAYGLHLLDARSGKLQGAGRNLVLWDAPRRLVVLDGRIIVTSGTMRAVTLVYGAPEVDR